MCRAARRGSRPSRRRRAGSRSARCLDRAVRGRPSGAGRRRTRRSTARLEVALQLRAGRSTGRAARDLPSRVVEEVEAEVEQAARTSAPSTSTCFSSGASRAGARSAAAGLLVQRYACRFGLVKSMVRRTASRRLIWPRSRCPSVGAIESSKSAMNTLRAGVQRVDDHLAVDRAGDLDAAILQVGRDAPGGWR
jgi:hypothetical protein